MPIPYWPSPKPKPMPPRPRPPRPPGGGGKGATPSGARIQKPNGGRDSATRTPAPTAARKDRDGKCKRRAIALGVRLAPYLIRIDVVPHTLVDRMAQGSCWCPFGKRHGHHQLR